jgi:hypothetical protein
MRNFVLFTKYYLSDEMEDMMGWTCSFTRIKINSYKVLAGKCETKGPLRRIGRRLEGDVKMDHKEYVERMWTEFNSFIIESDNRQQVGCLMAYSPTLKLEAICSSETSADFYRIALRYIPEDFTLHSCRCENFKSSLEMRSMRKLKEK